jgi:hypothetical protein
MKNSWKGALLSGLVFPGLGQIILRHYKRGIALMLAVSISLLVIVVKATRLAFAILEKIESEGCAIDIRTIVDAATQAFTTSDRLIYNFILLWIIFCWIIGVIDAYSLGKKKDIEEQSTSQISSSKANGSVNLFL